MIINGQALLKAAPIIDMVDRKLQFGGLSYGLSEVGYDIRLRERVQFMPAHHSGIVSVTNDRGVTTQTLGRTALASSIEVFNIPTNLWGELRNKSSNARRFLDAALGTDMEPGWRGVLTIEIVFHGEEYVLLEEGTPILKAVFHEIKEPRQYDGKYQDQAAEPVPPIFLKD